MLGPGHMLPSLVPGEYMQLWNLCVIKVTVTSELLPACQESSADSICDLCLMVRLPPTLQFSSYFHIWSMFPKIAITS